MKICTIDTFFEALDLLDKKLKTINRKIEIRAIGGFAMLYYGFREKGYTIDIDSLTEAYDESVIGLIQETGRELSIDPDWLNTDCAELEGFLGDLSEKITWKAIDKGLECINLKIADIKGLIRSKAKAIHEGGLVPRSTDKKDLLTGLSKVGIHNVSDLGKEYDFIREEYKRCYDFLIEQKKW